MTLVLDAESGELLHLFEGKKKASLDAFFGAADPGAEIDHQAACIERARAYRASIEERLPGVAIVNHSRSEEVLSVATAFFREVVRMV